eukprot:Skav235180  [mRNA]  locus=scaffold721:305116:309507:- [translate_table: standard]
MTVESSVLRVFKVRRLQIDHAASASTKLKNDMACARSFTPRTCAQNLLELGVPAGGRDSHDEVELGATVNDEVQASPSTSWHLLVDSYDSCKPQSSTRPEKALERPARCWCSTRPATCEANVNETGGIARETALHVAVQHNKIKVVQTLLAFWLQFAQFSCVEPTAGQSPLHRAARDGTVGCIQTLLAAAAVVDPRDTCEQTPVHIACFFGREDVVSKLLAARADARTLVVADRHSFSTLVQLIDKEIERREVLHQFFSDFFKMQSMY